MTITYNIDTVAGGEPAQRDIFEGPTSFFSTTISASAGNHNKDCGNIENSGGIDITYNMSKIAALARRVGER